MFTTDEMQALLNFLSTFTVKKLMRHNSVLLSIVTRLSKQTETVDIFMEFDLSKIGSHGFSPKVAQIKAVRHLTEIGLKEAKDLVETLNPGALESGTIGPVLANVPLQFAEERIAIAHRDCCLSFESFGNMGSTASQKIEFVIRPSKK